MLTLTYIPDDEWHGELCVEASHAGFSGKASAWFNRQDIGSFAADLRALASGRASVAELTGGYFSDSTTSSKPVETRVGIRIARQGIRLVANVELAEPGDAIVQQRAQLRFNVEWAALDSHANAIEAVLEAGGTALFA